MEFFAPFLKVFFGYWQTLWLMLLVGFVLSGFFYKFFPTHLIERYLGQKGIRSILIASIMGIMLPVCCLGTLPIALTLKRKGASLGSVLAFLVATPATSISALLVCFKLLGAIFTITIFVTVILMALIMGFLGDVLIAEKKENFVTGGSVGSCCAEPVGNISFRQKIFESLYYSFVTLPKSIGVQIILGIIVSSAIVVYEPIHYFIQQHLVGFVGYVFVIILGLVNYVCSTADVPMADAFIKSGLSHGQALAYLLAGPVTSYGTILVIKKDFGKNVLMLYLSVIVGVSLISGIIFDLLFYHA